MNCNQCGAQMADTAKFCGKCGSATIQTSVQMPIGFSTKITDPAFSKYIKSSNRWSAIFSVIIAIIAVIGFYIAGETSSEMDNPESLYIGFAIGGMFLLIAFFQILKRSLDKTWDGTVIDKKVEKKRRKETYGDNDFRIVEYYLYQVIIKKNTGKKVKLVARDNDILYNYYQVGDVVRHHKGMFYYEKYDKSRDNFAICLACGSLNERQLLECKHCHCPLL